MIGFHKKWRIHFRSLGNAEGSPVKSIDSAWPIRRDSDSSSSLAPNESRRIANRVGVQLFTSPIESHYHRIAPVSAIMGPARKEELTALFPSARASRAPSLLFHLLSSRLLSFSFPRFPFPVQARARKKKKARPRTEIRGTPQTTSRARALNAVRKYCYSPPLLAAVIYARARCKFP